MFVYVYFCISSLFLYPELQNSSSLFLESLEILVTEECSERFEVFGLLEAHCTTSRVRDAYQRKQDSFTLNVLVCCIYQDVEDYFTFVDILNDII